ncbi:anthranilate phosphoribosyltransferase [Saccharata proteae CBS 121410]|uniref:Anthranilate phosphoribosyltransferase n=1 Tax=Saccharata proteae CBS 121410 TaxID=1314787 RepID=A0A9P4HSG7_9PEZI|nr:anthranilate phosphoribosyltransferase [Saccharata proteae CBS 121410]
MSTSSAPTTEPKISITPLLKRLWPDLPVPNAPPVTAEEIALAISHIFTNSLSPVQTGALLTALHFKEYDRKADVLFRCAGAMREAAAQVDKKALHQVLRNKGHKEGSYRGGLCDIVGTGGDSHSTYNVSTTSSIIASSLLRLSKHGNRASTSKSGSADLLESASPRAPVISAVTPTSLPEIYEATNYAFLFAPVFHPAMKYVAPVRKELGWRTMFNLLGPLTNPVDSLIEARVIGVARRDVGPVFAEVLRLAGAKKALVICGNEDLDELSCAGPSTCWMLAEKPNPSYRVGIEEFTLNPQDFGFPPHPLSEVSPGKEPSENAAILMKILRNEMPSDDPILHFVLINTAALFVVSGVCEADQSSMGKGDDGNVITERGPGGGRWKEGIRRARWAIESGAALKQWEAFVEVTNRVNGA